MRPLSLDMRQRVLDTFLKGEMTYREVAELYDVSHSFVFNLVKLYKASGSVEARGHGGGNPGKIREEHHELIHRLVAENPDGILVDFAATFEGETGIEVSFMAIQRCFQKMGITLKKSRKKHRSASDQT